MQSHKRSLVFYALVTAGVLYYSPYAMAGNLSGVKNAIQVGEVSATAATRSSFTPSSDFSDKVLTDHQLFKASQSVSSLNKEDLNLFNPGAPRTFFVTVSAAF